MIYKVNTYAVITKNDGITQITISPSFLQTIEGAINIQYQKDTEFMTGVNDPNTAVISIIKPKVGEQENLRLFLNDATAWRMSKLDLFQSMDGGVSYLKIFSGLLFEKTVTLNTTVFAARGFLDLLNITFLDTPLFKNRKTATKIPYSSGDTDAQKYTKLTQQDPTIAAGADVGIINAILWLIGGRPALYKSLYTAQYGSLAGQYPKFYFDCETSIVNPEWIWFNYESLFQDLSNLCKASGGMLKQDTDGVVRYINVFSAKKDWNGLTLTDSDYADLSIGQEGTEPYSKIVTTYTPRYLANSQEVFKTVINEYINKDESVTRQVQFSKPIFKLVNKTTGKQLTGSFVGDTLKPVKETINAVDIFGTKRIIYSKVIPHKVFYMYKYVFSGALGNFAKVQDTEVIPSQTASMVFKNQTADNATLYIGEVSLFGRTLEAGGQENYTLPINQYPTISGYKELRIPDNPYVQSESQAVRLVNITKYLMENPRKFLTVNGVAFNEKLQLGDVIKVQSTFYNINEEFKIASLSFSNNLSQVNMQLLSMSGLYGLSSLFTVGTSYAGTDTKRITF